MPNINVISGVKWVVLGGVTALLCWSLVAMWESLMNRATERNFAEASNGHVQLECDVIAINGDWTTFTLRNNVCIASWRQNVAWLTLGPTPCWCVATSPCPPDTREPIAAVSIVRGLSDESYYVLCAIGVAVYVILLLIFACYIYPYAVNTWRFECASYENI
jgi:hypothetical protein